MSKKFYLKFEVFFSKEGDWDVRVLLLTREDRLLFKTDLQGLIMHDKLVA